MLLFEHIKQYLQSCGAESSMQTEIIVFLKLKQFNAYKMAGRDYNELLPGFVTSQPR